MNKVSWHWVKWVCNSKERLKEGKKKRLCYLEQLANVSVKTLRKWIKILKMFFNYERILKGTSLAFKRRTYQFENSMKEKNAHAPEEKGENLIK
jgi:hypothetical protein